MWLSILTSPAKLQPFVSTSMWWSVMVSILAFITPTKIISMQMDRWHELTSTTMIYVNMPWVRIVTTLPCKILPIMTSSNGNIFRVTGHLCGEFTDHQGQWRRALMFCFIYAWINGWVTNREAGDLRRHRAFHDVTNECRTWSFGFFFWMDRSITLPITHGILSSVIPWITMETIITFHDVITSNCLG